MKTTLKVSLKANERIYVNGAVIRVDRKTSMEFLNDVSFLLENHVLQSADADTPIRQLYYLIQLLMIDPNARTAVFSLYRSHITILIDAQDYRDLAPELKNIDRLVHEDCLFEALRNIRRTFGSEFDPASRPSSNKFISDLAHASSHPKMTMEPASATGKG